MLKKIFFSSLLTLSLLASKGEALSSYNCYDDSCFCDSFWVSADYLYWGIKDAPQTPPLVISTSVPLDFPVFESPGSSVVLGCDKIDPKWRSGGKFAAGIWFDCDHCFGAEVSYFFLPTASKSKSVSSTGLAGSATLTIPYFNINTEEEDSTGLACSFCEPPYFGDATVKQVNSMQGVELNALYTLASNCEFKAKGLLGFRYLNFEEHLKFNVNSPYVGLPDDVWLIEDKFSVENNFYGIQIGADMETAYDCFYVNARAKVGIGLLCGDSNIRGSLETNEFLDPPSTGIPVDYVGGIFALPSNIGHHKTTKFAVVPELGVNVGYLISEGFKVQIGYTVMFVNTMLRATDQIDRNINDTQSAAIAFVESPVLTGAGLPTGHVKTSSFWAQGLNVGVEFQF